MLSLWTFVLRAEAPKPMQNLVGTYKVLSVAETGEGILLKFEKHPQVSKEKLIALELSSPQKLLKEGMIVDLSAQVYDGGKTYWEAQQIFIEIPQVQGKARLWLSSRTGTLNFENVSYLKMHTEDYLLL